MRTRVYPNTMRDFATLANTVSRNLNRYNQAYDYERNGGSNDESKVRLPVDIWSTDEAYHISAYLPGVDPESVDITFVEDKLTISGHFAPLAGSENHEQSGDSADEHANENGDENAEQSIEPKNDVKYMRRELFHGAFERTLNFNVPVNADDITASFKHGVLTLDVPKVEEVLPKQIKIQVS